MKWAVALVVSVVALIAPAASIAQRKPSVQCSDDRGVDRCSAERFARTLKLFGAPPIEQHRAAGDLVRRAFYVDGYGRDVIGIAFIRPRGGDPLLRVYLKQEEGEKQRPPMEAAVTGHVWDEIVRRSENFHRSLKPAPPLPDNVVAVCMHGWVYTVEALDQPNASEPMELRRTTQGACDDGLVPLFAVELYKAAVPLLPYCALLDSRNYRNGAELLSTCGILDGDRLAAAEVLNEAEPLVDFHNQYSADTLLAIFHPGLKLDWAGEKIEDYNAAARVWGDKVRSGKLRFYIDRVRGESPERVILNGGLVGSAATAGSDEEVSHIAPVELVWTRNGDFGIESAVVGALKPLPPG